LHLWTDAVGQRYGTELIVDLLAGEKIIDVVVKNNLDNTQPEHGNGANAGFALHGVHANFDGRGYEALNFFGRAAFPFRYDNNLRVCNIWKSLEWRGKVTGDTGNDEADGHEKDEKAVLQRKTNYVTDESIHS